MQVFFLKSYEKKSVSYILDFNEPMAVNCGRTNNNIYLSQRQEQFI